MKIQFNELAESHSQSGTRRGALKKFGVGLAGITLAGLLALPAVANDLRLGPLVELSRPNAVAGCDDGLVLPGPYTLDDAGEPVVAVNPLNPRNIVAAWVGGPYQNIIAAASFDEGRNWQRIPIPFTLCSGGPFLGTGNPWLSFAPNGDLYATAVAGDSFDNPDIAVTKSTDGGLHWGSATPIYGSLDAHDQADKPSITADPANPGVVYAVWLVYDAIDGDGDRTVFSRTTDGGATWESARTIYMPGGTRGHNGDQIVVLPNGSLVCMFQEQVFNDAIGDWDPTGVALLRSTDQGQTWSGPIRVADQAWVRPTDPENGVSVKSRGLPACAVDRRSGNLYAVWEDARFGNSQYSDIVFSMSADSGLNWSAPIRINQTPRHIAPVNRQSFLPCIAVAADGTIGVSYYDFRFNDRRPGLPTDYWLVQCHPTRRVPATDPANWGDEVRLTQKSFDMERAWAPLFEYLFFGYESLSAVGNDFVTAFGQVDRDSITGIFFRRVSR